MLAAPAAAPSSAADPGMARETPDEPFRSGPPEAREAKAFVPPTAARLQLHNGIPAYVITQPSWLCAVRVVATGGIADAMAVRRDGAEATNEMAALMLSGTRTRDYAALHNAFAALFVPYARYNTFYDAVQVHASCPCDKLAQMFDLLSDITLRPSFESKAFERYREQDARSLEDRLLDAGTVADRVLGRVVFGTHPYGAFATPARVRALSRAALVDLYARLFVPARLSIVVAGSVSPDEVKGALEDTFGAAKVPAAAPAIAATPAPAEASGARLVVVDMPGATIAAVDVGFASTAPAAPDADAAMLAVQGLARNPLGRLNRRLRDELGLVPWVQPILWTWRAGALVGCKTRAPSAQVATVLTEADRALRTLDGDGLTDDEVATIRDEDELGFAWSFKTAAESAEIYGNWLRWGLSLQSLAEHPARLAAVTADSVRAAAGRYLKPERMHVVVVGDWAALRAPLSALGWGQIELRDATGAVVHGERGAGASR